MPCRCLYHNCLGSRPIRAVNPEVGTKVGDEEDLRGNFVQNKKGGNNVGARRATVAAIDQNNNGGNGGGTRRATLAATEPPAFFLRQNSATKIQSMVRMAKGKKKVDGIKEDRRKSMASVSSAPQMGEHHEVDRVTYLKRQNSATKIQAVARMKKGKEKVKTMREQRKMSAV